MRNSQDDILLRERSRKERVDGKRKSGILLLTSSVIIWTLLSRKERCSKFGKDAIWRRAEIDVISLLSRVSFLTELESGLDKVVSWLADAMRTLSAGNLAATAAICAMN